MSQITSDFPSLQTRRLLLNAFTIDDAAEVQRLAGDAAIAKTTSNIPHPYPDGLAERWISMHTQQWRAGSDLNLAVRLQSTGQLIGAIGLMNIVADHKAEMGYWIGKPYWSKGYCTEAAAELIDYSFKSMGLIRIYARHMAANPASGRVMEKVGMQREGLFKADWIIGGQYEDVAFCAILNPQLGN